MAARTRSTPPLSRHPLFPPLVGLWFAALLGLGSLVVRASALEQLVLALRLDLVMPAAAPPLGLSARLAVAVALGVGGGLLGYVLARRVGAVAPCAASRSRRPDRTPRESPAADDGEDLARLSAARTEPPAPAGPTRPQTMAELAPRILNFSDLDPLPPLEDEAHADPMPVDPEPTLAAAPAAPPAPPPLAPLPLAATIPAEATAAGRLCGVPLDTLGVVELVERFALALAARRTTPEAPMGGVRPFDTPASQGGGARIPAAPFDSPGLPVRAANDSASAPPVIVLPARGAQGGEVICVDEVEPGADPARTELALHKALAALQRISGAA